MIEFVVDNKVFSGFNKPIGFNERIAKKNKSIKIRKTKSKINKVMFSIQKTPGMHFFAINCMYNLTRHIIDP